MDFKINLSKIVGFHRKYHLRKYVCSSIEGEQSIPQPLQIHVDSPHNNMEYLGKEFNVTSTVVPL
jgi:hypothetical protein